MPSISRKIQTGRPRQRVSRAAVVSLMMLLPLSHTSAAAAADNDDFDAATPIATSALPYTTTADLASATRAQDDPSECSQGGPTVWFSYTAVTDQRLVATVALEQAHGHISAYTGTRGALTARGICDWHEGVVDVSAGETVYFSVEDVFLTGGVETFTLQVAPPPVDINNLLSNTGTINRRTGTATVSGSVTCNVPAQVSGGGELRQKQGLTIARGSFYFELNCEPGTASKWTSTVDAGSRAFVNGAATLSVSSSGCDRFTCDQATTSASVRLNGR